MGFRRIIKNVFIKKIIYSVCGFVEVLASSRSVSLCRSWARFNLNVRLAGFVCVDRFVFFMSMNASNSDTMFSYKESENNLGEVNADKRERWCIYIVRNVNVANVSGRNVKQIEWMLLQLLIDEDGIGHVNVHKSVRGGDI